MKWAKFENMNTSFALIVNENIYFMKVWTQMQ